MFFEPTIFGGVTHDMTIAREEIFGPVLATLDVRRRGRGRRARQPESYGLAAAVWTRDIKKAHALARRLKAGTVWINTYNLMDAALPFGGYKQSGFGRELGAHALEKLHGSEDRLARIDEVPRETKLHAKREINWPLTTDN